MRLRDLITVLVPTSPIPSHPSTDIIEQALTSIREKLPTSPILILADGVRYEQEERRAAYNLYLDKLHVLVAKRFHNIRIIVSIDHLHQSGLTRRALDLYVNTPLILFHEHDCLFTHQAIDFHKICDVILLGKLNMVEFHIFGDPWIHPEQASVMLDTERHWIDGLPVVRTYQWSQRPHVASVQFYRQMFAQYIPRSLACMIEDKMNPIVRDAQAHNLWSEFRLAYYAPEGPIQRSWTLDGRQGDPKWPGV